MIPVTKPFLPPKEEYVSYLNGIWDRQSLTNTGPLSIELEDKLMRYLQINNLLFVSNGTIALQMAIKALGLKGEILTTPFSFVATTSSIVWEGCTPVFVDIDEKSLNIDVSKLEAAINERTTAILATHVYGNPCDVVEIDRIAKKHNLKVIYDGAHAFGVKIKDKSIFEFGDISTCSLHATKLYHSIEGGLIATNDPTLLQKLYFIRNFGFNGPTTFVELGINGKNSEFHAAMGLVNLKYISEILERRKNICERYDEQLAKLNVKRPIWHADSKDNYAYYTLIFESEESMLNCAEYLKQHQVFTRRYFYPSLAKVLPYLNPVSLDVTDRISKCVLCLPLYHELTIEEVDWICKLVIESQDHNL